MAQQFSPARWAEEGMQVKRKLKLRLTPYSSGADSSGLTDIMPRFQQLRRSALGTADRWVGILLGLLSKGDGQGKSQLIY